VGASGSWGSHRSFARFTLGLGGPYARVYADRRATAATFASIGAGDGRLPPPPAGRLARHRDFAYATYEEFRGFGPFPARHVRSTGFMLEADSLLALLDTPLRTKFDTYRAEAGIASLSAQVEAAGRRLLVVGRDGRGYAAPDWPESRTFWQAEQENLMIADKQTTSYAASDDEQRGALSRYAWGLRAGAASNAGI
jgi:hypothetical protein